MELTTGFLIYATLFRLAIIFVGAVSIYLGYKLFLKDPVGRGKPTVTVESTNFNLTLKNFWPGIYFAAFGTAVIGLMLWQGSPALVMEELKSAENVVNAETIVRTELRGGGDIAHHWQQLSDPSTTLGNAQSSLTELARLLQTEQRGSEALSLAQLAAVIKTDDNNQKAEQYALYARLLAENGRNNDAVETMEAAAKIDSRYNDEVKALRAQ